MTYLEKAKEMLKDAHYVNWDRFVQIVCPMDIGMENKVPRECEDIQCKDCWNREYTEEQKKETRRKTKAEVFFERFPNAKKNEISGDPEVCAKNIFGSDILCHRNCWICWNKPAPKEYQNMDKKKVEVEDRWAYMEDGSAVCPRCGKRYERRKFEFVGACCEACGANNIVKTEIKEDE